MSLNRIVVMLFLATVVVASGCVNQNDTISSTQGEVEDIPTSDPQDSNQQESNTEPSSNQQTQTQSYSLEISVEGQGTVSPSEGSHAYEEGETVSLNPNADENWMLESFEGDCSGNNCELTMSSDRSVTVNFAQEPVSYSGINQQIAVSDFQYGGNFQSAVMPISNDRVSRQFSFIVDYTPQNDRDLHFHAYTEGANGQISTSEHKELQPGENKVQLTSETDTVDESTEVHLCYSYTEFYVSSSGEFQSLEDRDELSEDEYVCQNKVFDEPRFNVDTPSTVEFNVDASGASEDQVLYDSNTIEITNDGDFTQTFYLFVPNENDGTSEASQRPDQKPSFRENNLDYEANLEPGESRTFQVDLNLIYSEGMDQYFQDTAYIYTVPSDCEGYYEADCQEDAGWKERITLETTVMN